MSSADLADYLSVQLKYVDGISKVFKAQSGADGAIHLLFDGDDGPFYASLAPGTKAFSPVRNLNRKPSEGFSLAADDRGSVAACFLSGKLFAMVSRDNGESFGASEENDPAWNPCDCCTTSAAYGKDGKLAVLYREETNNDRDMYTALWDQSRGAKPTRGLISTSGWNVNACPMTYFTKIFWGGNSMTPKVNPRENPAQPPAPAPEPRALCCGTAISCFFLSS